MSGRSVLSAIRAYEAPGLKKLHIFVYFNIKNYPSPSLWINFTLFKLLMFRFLRNKEKEVKAKKIQIGHCFNDK